MRDLANYCVTAGAGGKAKRLAEVSSRRFATVWIRFDTVGNPGDLVIEKKFYNCLSTLPRYRALPNQGGAALLHW
jgi:hypothetical protein